MECETSFDGIDFEALRHAVTSIECRSSLSESVILTLSMVLPCVTARDVDVLCVDMCKSRV